MQSKNIFIQIHWLVTIMLLFTLSIAEGWGTLLFEDSFSTATGNGSYTSRTGWTLSNTYAHYGTGIRLGTSGGYATKTAITSIVGSKNLAVTIYAANWNNDGASLIVTVNGTARIDGNSTKTFSSVKKTENTGKAVGWDNSYKLTFTITGATSSTTINFL